MNPSLSRKNLYKSIKLFDYYENIKNNNLKINKEIKNNKAVCLSNKIK